MKTETIGQPHAIAAGPPLFQPRPNEVKQPARIEMIENEIAKLEKPDQERVQLLYVAEFGEMFLVVAEMFVALWHGDSPSRGWGQNSHRHNKAPKVWCPTFGGDECVNLHARSLTWYPSRVIVQVV